MEPTYYTVISINGDYAMMITDDGIENMVALALLPPEVDQGCRVIYEGLSYTII